LYLPDCLQAPSPNGIRRDAEFNPRDAGFHHIFIVTLAVRDDATLSEDPTVNQETYLSRLAQQRFQFLAARFQMFPHDELVQQ